MNWHVVESRELVNRYKGVGVAKAAAIVAAMEIGRRRKPMGQEQKSVTVLVKMLFYISIRLLLIWNMKNSG